MPTMIRINLQLPSSNSQRQCDVRRTLSLLGVGFWELGVSTGYHRVLFKRQTSGSVLCTSCGVLVGVNDDVCYNCGRRNPALWGFAPALRSLGADLGFVPFVTGTCVILYALTLLASKGDIGMSGLFG